ncbi:MAG: BglG family transcription antiterminator [Brevibacillus sp.]|nr:BglG family transcription antiterminator [Brevibacillus sp.]
MDQRSTLLLTLLLFADRFLTIEEIAVKMQVSRRTVYYDLQKVNHWLQEHHLEPVEHVRSSGLYLPDRTRQHVPRLIQQIDTRQYYYSMEERRAWLAISLLTEERPLYLHDLMERIEVSRGTTFKELNRLRNELADFRLTLTFDRKQGYLIEGSESDMRRAVVHYFSQLLSRDGWHHLVAQIQMYLHSDRGGSGEQQPRTAPAFTEEQLCMVYQLIDQCEKELGIRLTDEMVHQLAYRLILFAKRIGLGKSITMDRDEVAVLKTTPEFKAAKNISAKLAELFSITYPDDEICYIAVNLLGAKVNKLSLSTSPDQDVSLLRNVVCRMIDDFQRYACVFFRDRAALEESLLIHLKPAFYRIKYGLDIQNPLTDAIKEKYAEIFEVTRKVVPHLEKAAGRQAVDAEVAYIAMHFGGWLKREGASVATRKKALIVCGNGISTSRILQAQLEQLLSSVDIVGAVSLRDYESGCYDVDFIVSTAPIPKKGIPVFVVSTILTDTEKETLLNQVNRLDNRQERGNNPRVKAVLEVIRRHARIANEAALLEELSQVLHIRTRPEHNLRKPNLHELLTREMIQCGRADDWREAIRLAARPLLQKGMIDRSYVEAMIRNVEEMGPYIVIGPKVAIPHARPEQGVHQLGMSLLRLEQNVSFSDEEKHQAALIIVVATVDDALHLKALSQLSAMIANHLEEILTAPSPDDILRWIQHYSISNVGNQQRRQTTIKGMGWQNEIFK